MTAVRRQPEGSTVTEVFGTELARLRRRLDTLERRLAGRTTRAAGPRGVIARTSTVSAVTGIGTGGTTLLALTDVPFETGRLYTIEAFTRLQANSASDVGNLGVAFVRIGGTVVGGDQAVTVGSGSNLYVGLHPQARARTQNTVADVTLTMQARSGAVYADASSGLPIWLQVLDVGAA